ncbi:hypothetical protein PUN28_016481 [Cardiocondyla obscurior]|uniref:Uncharacterized protein n=1 Tax=Cardiocondyla obscurior TaxID=286306 RepID=A0AAW2EPC8_9HYME
MVKDRKTEWADKSDGTGFISAKHSERDLQRFSETQGQKQPRRKPSLNHENSEQGIWICQASVPLRGTKPLSTMGFMLCPAGYLPTP